MSFNHPPIDIVEKSDSLGCIYLRMNRDRHWYGSMVEYPTANELRYIGEDEGRSNFHYTESFFKITFENLQKIYKKSHKKSDKTITLSYEEASSIIEAVSKSIEGLFPNICSENIWGGSPFKKLASFVDVNKEA